MSIPNWVTDVFASIDSKDTKTFCSFLTEDANFIYANQTAVTGRDNIYQAVDGFFGSIKALKHSIENCWKDGNAVIVNGHVSYTRHDETILNVPFADIFLLDGDKVKDYIIYIDISELYK